VAAVEEVEVDVEDVQILDALAAATYAPHLQTLLDEADKGACPPLAAEADKVALRPLSCNNLFNAMLLWCTPTLSRDMQIGMCISHTGLMWKMGMHPKHAMFPGDTQITRRGLIRTIQVSTSQQGTTRALR
jgi:hypothetical protein